MKHDDPKTHVIGLYLEDIRDAPRFLSLIKKNKQKPIVLLKSGKSEQGKKAIGSHTGSLAGNYSLIEGLSKQFGLYLVDSYQEMFDLIAILCQYPMLKSPKVGIISISGSGCVMAADFAAKHHIELVPLSPGLHAKLKNYFPPWAPISNPLDTWASIERVGSTKSFRELLNAYLQEEIYDAIILMTIATDLGAFDWDYLNSVRKNYPNIVIILHFFGGEKIHEYSQKAIKYRLPVVNDMQFIFRALSMMWKNHRFF